MLCLLECTTVEVDGAFSPPPFEAVMGLTQAMQAAAVHRQIQADMLAYCLAAAAETQAAAAAAGETGELRAAAAAACSLPGWAKSSQWARSTGGELDEHGAPVRAQTGVWKDLWDYTLASSHAAAAAAAPPPPPPALARRGAGRVPMARRAPGRSGRGPRSRPSCPARR
jgi:leucyl aminopeptidase (aminopeptidase T)